MNIFQRSTLKSIEKSGYVVTYLPVDKYGMVNPDDVKRPSHQRQRWYLSCMPMGRDWDDRTNKGDRGYYEGERYRSSYGRSCGTGNIPIDVLDTHIDALSMSANQFYSAVRDWGALSQRRNKDTSLHGRRCSGRGCGAGTENIAGIVGMGKAAELAKLEMSQRMDKVQNLRGQLRDGILNKISHVYLNGHPTNRLPGNLSLCIEFIEGESVLLFLDMQGVAISSGSACTSRTEGISRYYGYWCRCSALLRDSAFQPGD